MEHRKLASMARVLIAAVALLGLVSPAFPQDAAQQPDSSKNKILDLVFRVDDLAGKVQDLGGKVHDLQVKETGEEIRIELAADVLFDFDKANLRPAAQQTLHQAAGIVQEKAKGVVRIEGHTDSKGNDAYNQKLSERRAESVKTWFMVKEGLDKVQFSTQGFGAKKPVAPNTKPDGSDDPEGRQKNRRVEIIIKK